MSTDAMEEEAELSGSDWSDSPFPDSLIHAWLSLLEAAMLGGLTTFVITMLEGGEIIPNVLAELRVGLGVFAITFVVLVYVRHFRD
ncbi:hypothetical protein KTS45_18970 [Halomicroarcula limicola]|uniref:Uncharacterized protein n=1 Tax=Haloarcula limicola TaxID=1429915 RepID=A0A8J8C6J8_9EURY|nr:hypothetical protein [Halomicroarcula limicola]MBV0926294.1 hypothetical protein [Halomicroarcula limicola]